MNKDLVIGLDCGATHTKIYVWKNSEVVFEDDDWPGMNMDLIRSGSALEEFGRKLNKIKNYSNYLWVVALAGVDDKNEIAEASSWWKTYLVANDIKFSDVKIMSDIYLVLWSGSDKGVGIALISGTGSNCLGKNEAGLEVKVGGMSHLMSDEGSGFSLGWKTMRLVTKMNDGRTPKTGLQKAVLDFYHVKSIVDLKNLLLSSDNLKAEIAKCTPVLLEHAFSGDQEAAEIVDDEINELVLMIETVNRKLSQIKTYPVYISGSLFKNEDFMERLVSNVHLSFPEQEVRKVSPIDGVKNFVASLSA